jgi:hypothetical protein
MREGIPQYGALSGHLEAAGPVVVEELQLFAVYKSDLGATSNSAVILYHVKDTLQIGLDLLYLKMVDP